MAMQTYEVIAEFEMDGGGGGELEGETVHPNNSRLRPLTPPLFEQTRLRKPEYWQCIKLISPSEDESRNWKAADALGAWCMVCRKKVRWRLGKSTGIHRHMETYHQDLLQGFRLPVLSSLGTKLEEGISLQKKGSSFYRKHKRRSTPPLFNQVRLRRPEYWQCIKLIAPSDERKTWKASDALGSWCTLCDEEVTWTLGNIQGVKRHMMSHHRDLLELKKEDSPFPFESPPDPSSSSQEDLREAKDFLKSLNKDHQKIGDAVLIKWISESLQPFNIVENSSFQDLVQFLCNFKGEFTLPDGKTVEKRVRKLAKSVSEKMLETISRDVRYFCLCMNSWNLGKGDMVVLELIMRYFTSDFDLKRLTLEVELTHGNFTRESIQAWLEASLHKWGLPRATMAALTGDHDKSVIFACKAMDIKHLGCIGRGLRRIASVFLCDDSFFDGDDLNEEDILSHEEINISELLHSQLVIEIRKLIQEVRTIARYIKFSKMAQEKITELGQALKMEVVLLYFDVRPQWNSSYDVISKLIKLKNLINIFLEHLKTPAGLAEFDWKDLPTLSEEKWYLLEGIHILLGCFYQVHSLLNHEKNPTVVYALSILRRVERILKDPTIFCDLYTGPLQKRVVELKETYGKNDFYPQAIQKLDYIRSTLSDLFESHFSAFDSSIIWITVLDPRLRKMKYLSVEERNETRSILIKEVAELKMENNACISNLKEENMDDLEDSDLFNPCDIFDSATTSVWKDPDDEGRPSSSDFSAAEREVNNYLHDDMLVSFKKDPFEWWKQHRFQFPQIAVLAMKWLSASAISIPFEKFETDIKYHKHRTNATKDQLMIMKNSTYLNLSIDDIVKGLEG
ncbi:E3 SUMO-protein ligase ZBED1 [Lepeophtheirus salmonis]|uniref:E3 SUMO-protein ligase ZBED1 n=1 Tax=Lepeophtheirus salmonis TaxID=72036 RepID=UPI001AE502C8|nr:uncharacterized protein LOC121119129 [Lepeophtheirus salmonis]XP_040569700.1 uncharacterized protein LOC121119129 [Lepeophtheirus salmonis]